MKKHFLSFNPFIFYIIVLNGLNSGEFAFSKEKFSEPHSSILIDHSTESQLAVASERRLSVKKEDGQTSFVAVGWPSALKIRGEAGSPSGVLTLSKHEISGELVLSLTDLDTHIKTRNEHMLQTYLETSKFPNAKIRITNLAVPKNIFDSKQTTTEETIDFAGMLSLHGIEKVVSGKALLKRADGKLSILANFTIDLPGFNIAIPEFAGITIAKNVDVSVHMSTLIDLSNQGEQNVSMNFEK